MTIIIIIINVSWAENLHMRMISERLWLKTCDWTAAENSALHLRNKLLLRYIAIENTCFKLQTYLIILVFLLYFLTN